MLEAPINNAPMRSDRRIAPSMLTSLRKTRKGYYISLIVKHENRQAHAPSDLAVDRDLTKPITCRAASMDPATARTATKIPNLERRAGCLASQPCGPPGRGTVARL